MQRLRLFFIFVTFFFAKAYTQKVDFIHPPLLGVSFQVNDYKNHKPFGKLSNMSPGLGIQFVNGLNNSWDWFCNLNGSFPDSATSHSTTSSEKNLLLEADASIRGRMFRGDARLQPYLSAGIGVSIHRNYYGVYIPAGTGIQYRISDEAYVSLAAQYRLSLVEVFNNHFYYSVTLSGAIGKPKIKKQIANKVMIPPQVVHDRDHDGIMDSVDVCPDQPGLARFKGCPDRDNDGIPDREDQCPDRFGIARYRGCPIPDTDRDGINDEEDKCPTVPGIIRLHGCPEQDRDKDGVIDEEDKCPDLPGVRENQGCPLIKEELGRQLELAAKNIFFKTGSFDLLPKSYPSLDEVAVILKENIRVKLNIEGHTDNIGKPEKNQLLSENRAKAVGDYLQTKGIGKSRLQTSGYGQEKPVATNNTAEGRATNRRVVLRLYYD